MTSVVLVNNMGSIFVRVLDDKSAFETLLYVFANQVHLGKKVLTFSLKHRDGYKEWCRGSVDKVFKDELMDDIEYGDLLILEHHDSIIDTYINFNDQVDMEMLVLLASKMKRGCYFTMPRGNPYVYVTIKDYPMSSYTINKNEIISDNLFGSTASVMNNMCGKFDHLRGLFVTKQIK